MKRVVLAALLVCLSVTAFADFQLGVLYAYDGDPAAITASQLVSAGVVGVEARTTFWIFQLGVSGLSVSSSPGSSDLLVLPDAGIAVDLSIFRLAASVGWVAWLSPGGAYVPSYVDGMNLKAGLDVNIGPIALGIVSYWIFNPEMVFAGILPFSRPPVLGLTAMITLGRK